MNNWTRPEDAPPNWRNACAVQEHFLRHKELQQMLLAAIALGLVLSLGFLSLAWHGHWQELAAGTGLLGVMLGRCWWLHRRLLELDRWV